MAAELELLSIVNDIYAAALDPVLWPAVVKRIVEAVGGETGQLHSNNRMVLQNLWAPYGFGVVVMGPYAQYYHQHDEWTLAADATGLPACQAVTGEQLVQIQGFKNSEFYNDFLKKFGFERLVCCYIDPGRDGDLTKTALCAYRPPGSEPFDQGAIELLNIIAPHVRRAVQFHWRIHDLEHRQAANTQVLERLAVGVALVDETCRVTYLNPAAQAIVSVNDGLGMAGGKLKPALTAEAEKLSRLVTEAVRATVSLDISRTGTMTVTRHGRDLPYRLTVIPVPVRGAFAVGRQRTAAIVFISEAQLSFRNGADLVTRIYSLSEAESRLLTVLLEGQPLKRAADCLGVSFNTAHTQLNSILRKTGTHRQTELTRLVMSVAGVMQT